MLLMTLDEAGVQACEICKVMRDYRAAMGSCPTQVLFVSHLYVAFDQRMSYFVPELP